MAIDLNNGYRELREHVHHDIVCVSYGSIFFPEQNIALECETCGCVLIDFNKPEDQHRANPDGSVTLISGATGQEHTYSPDDLPPEAA